MQPTAGKNVAQPGPSFVCLIHETIPIIGPKASTHPLSFWEPGYDLVIESKTKSCTGLMPSRGYPHERIILDALAKIALTTMLLGSRFTSTGPTVARSARLQSTCYIASCAAAFDGLPLS